jgi:virginiamycin B lyase
MAQQSSNQNYVTYQKQSNFIHEVSVPLVNQRGLKGITTDLQGNAWFYHQTNKTSTLMKFNLENNTFNSYPIDGKTVTDNTIINLAGGQIIYDEKRNSIWFTDARINSIGRLDINSGKIVLTKIPTNNSGIMGIVLSPDDKEIWFAEIIGNKIGRFDIESSIIDEYPTGDTTGPTLLSFDKKGQLWVTLSYAKSVLMIQPWLIIPATTLSGMFEIKLEKPDTFSPFGISIISNKSTIYLSDHGSSRLIVSNITSELKEYISYWTSPSQSYPATLPSQVVSDKFGNIYFPEHGGNRISKISPAGLMTEFDIPTGPLATAVYIAVSPDASKVWFTEWASNKIAYLDNSMALPLELKPKNASQINFKVNQTYPLDILVTKNNITGTSPVSVNEIELSATGMTDSGLQGLTYLAKPQRFDMTENTSMEGTIDLTVNAKEAIPGKYTVMPRISTLEKDNLAVSLLYPQTVTLDVPVHRSQIQNLSKSVNNEEGSNSIFIFLRDFARYASIGVAVTLIGYLVYRKIGKGRVKKKFR